MNGKYNSKPSFLEPRDPSVDRRYRPRPERQVNLCNVIERDEDMADETLESTSSVENELTLVYLRLRPTDNCCKLYKISNTTLTTCQPDNTANNRKKLEKEFSFSSVFDSTVSQSYIYDACLQNKMDMEENFTILTYGTSGSGKTYTLLGDYNNPGIIPRALENIFTKYADNIYDEPGIKICNATVRILDDEMINNENYFRNKILGSIPGSSTYPHIREKIERDHDFNTHSLLNTSVFIWVSFVEIYNETVSDLLTLTPMTAFSKKKGLKIISNDGKVFVKGLTSVFVKTSAEAYKLLTYGLNQVTYASTSINLQSSRSHCIFIVDVITLVSPDIISHKSYKFCDLAGSERVAKTGNVGCRLKEAKNINTSLLVLGRCLEAAYNNQHKKINENIPFRESKLTMLLQAPLIGKEKLSMFVNITPSEQYLEENLTVLVFASIARNIAYKSAVGKTTRKRFSVLNSQATTKLIEYQKKRIEDLEEENYLLHNEICKLTEEHEKQLAAQETRLRQELVAEFEVLLANRTRAAENKLSQQKLSLARLHEVQMESLRQHYEQKLEALEEELERKNLEADDDVIEA